MHRHRYLPDLLTGLLHPGKDWQVREAGIRMVRLTERVILIVCVAIVVTGIGLPVIAVTDGLGSAGAVSGQNTPVHGSPAPDWPADPTGPFDVLPVPGSGIQPGDIRASVPAFQWAVPSPVGVHPNYVAVDSAGTIYATDTINNSVWSFHPDGTDKTK